MRRCNQGYDAAQFAPVFVGDPWRPETMAAHVGFASAALVRKLRGFHLPGAVAPAVEVGPNPLARIASPEDGALRQDASVDAVFLAPRAAHRGARLAALVDALVADADRVESGRRRASRSRPARRPRPAPAPAPRAAAARRSTWRARRRTTSRVPRAKLRDELQDVRPPARRRA